MGRRRDRTPSCKSKRTPSATVSSPAPKRRKTDRYVSPDALIAANSETINVEGSHTREEKQDGKHASPQKAVGKIKEFEETTAIVKHGAAPGREEQANLPLDNRLDNLEPIVDVSENAGLLLTASKETNRDCSPTCNPEVQLAVRIQADNPAGVSLNMTLSQSPASTFICDVDANTSACTLQVQQDDQDIFLTSRVEEVQIDPQVFQINETSSIASKEHNKPGNGGTDSQVTNKITSQELVWVSEVLQLDNTFYATMDNDKPEEPPNPDLNKNDNLALVSRKNPSFPNNDEILREMRESNGLSDATVNVQARHLPCCNTVAVLTNQNGALQKEIQSLQNELASLSCQMFDLEARCGKLESTNQQLLCRIRDYSELGSREEILSCGQQIGQFADFLQAMLEEIPPSNQNLNDPSGSGPSFLHTLH